MASSPPCRTRRAGGARYRLVAVVAVVLLLLASSALPVTAFAKRKSRSRRRWDRQRAGRRGRVTMEVGAGGAVVDSDGAGARAEPRTVAESGPGADAAARVNASRWMCEAGDDACTEPQWDENGYLLYVPESGRFGNQADFFLGALLLCHRLNRTLVVAPFVDFTDQTPPQPIPIARFFDLHAAPNPTTRIVDAEVFFNHPNLAPRHWPEGSRKFYHVRRLGRNLHTRDTYRRIWASVGLHGLPPGLSKEEESPEAAVALGSIGVDLTFHTSKAEWDAALPPAEHPVFMMPYSPGPFPVLPAAYGYQRYFVWNEDMRARGDAYIREHLSVPDPSAGAGAVREAVWIAIHLRVGGDWRQVCKGYKQNGEDVAPAVGKKLHYASPQCLRGKYKNHLITPDLCLPSVATVVRQVREAVERVGATHVYVGSDVLVSNYIARLRELTGADGKPLVVLNNRKAARPNRTALPDGSDGKRLLGEAYRTMRRELQGPPSFMLDMYLYAKSSHFIASCLSSFSSFAVRERWLNNRSVEFMGLPESPWPSDGEYVAPSMTPEGVTWDPAGYLAYCPASGRFGNQIDYLLGALSLARRINRTLVVPPWIDYSTPKRSFIGLFQYFDMHAARNPDARIVDAGVFASHPDLAPKHWPAGSRQMFHSTAGRNVNLVRDCARMWASAGLELPPAWSPQTSEAAEAAGSKALALIYRHPADAFARTVPASEYPVLLLPTMPGPYPAEDKDWPYQRYLVWNSELTSQWQADITSRMRSVGARGRPQLKWIAIHLRVGFDWSRMCYGPSNQPDRAVIGQAESFSSRQCMHAPRAPTAISEDMCLPSVEVVVAKVKEAVARIGATHVYVGSDTRAAKYLEALRKLTRKDGRTPLEVILGRDLPHPEPSLVSRDDDTSPPPAFLRDLFMFGQASHFIGSCLSSFTHFAARERSQRGQSVGYWGVGGFRVPR